MVPKKLHWEGKGGILSDMCAKSFDVTFLESIPNGHQQLLIGTPTVSPSRTIISSVNLNSFH